MDVRDGDDEDLDRTVAGGPSWRGVLGAPLAQLGFDQLPPDLLPPVSAAPPSAEPPSAEPPSAEPPPEPPAAAGHPPQDRTSGS